MHRWQVALSGHGLVGGQVLPTASDFAHRERYLNLSATLRALFAFGAIPVINENDTVSVDELTLGDNDRLSAMVASQLDAERLLLLTDIEGLYNADPSKEENPSLIPHADRITDEYPFSAGGAGRYGTGGMRSKPLRSWLPRRGAGTPCRWSPTTRDHAATR